MPNPRIFDVTLDLTDDVQIACLDGKHIILQMVLCMAMAVLVVGQKTLFIT